MAAEDRTDIASAEDSSHLHSWRLGIVVTSLCLGVVLYGLDMNIIGVAVPVITTEFHSLGDIAWYSAAYLLTITAFQPFFGNLYKYFSAKIVYLASIILFEAGSVICATASSSAILIFGRAFLGFGASGLLQGALAIVSYVVSLEQVPKYQGIVAGAAAVSACAGPVIGGALTDHVSWRWCFWINVPVGGTVLICVFLFCKISPNVNKENLGLSIREKLKHLDAIGTVFFLGSIVSLLLVLQWGGLTISWNSATSIGLFVCFGICGIIFAALQWRLGEYATIPIRVIRVRSIYMGSLVLFMLGIASISLAYYLPLYFQAIQGVSATDSGVNMIAYVAPTIVAIGITGSLVSKWGHYVPFMILGIGLCVIPTGFITQFDAYTSTVKWAALIVTNRLTMGMAQQQPYTALQAVLEPSDTATGNAIMIFMWQLGGAIAVSIGENLLVNRLKDLVPQYTTAVSVQRVIDAGAGGLKDIAPNAEVLQQLRQAYAESIRGTFILALVGTCLALPCAAGMQWVNIKQVAEERKRKETDKRESSRALKGDVELVSREASQPVSPEPHELA